MNFFHFKTCIFIFALFCTSVFAEPGNPPSQSNSPSQSNPPAKENPSSQTPSVPSVQKENLPPDIPSSALPPQEELQGEVQKEQSEPPALDSATPPPENFPPKNPPKNSNRQPSKQNENIINYRGNRTIADSTPLAVNSVKAVHTNKKNVTLEISFNQNINPRSVNIDSIFIDDSALPKETKFSFNKKGDTIKINIPLELVTDSESVLVKIQNVRSFNGTKIEPVEIFAKVSD